MMRCLIAILCLLPLRFSTAGEPVWQPIIDYTVSLPATGSTGTPSLNPFENFTHFASDFGWMGPGQDRIRGQDGAIRIEPGLPWTGAWHSLAGLAREPHRKLDPLNVLGLTGTGTPGAEIRGLTVDALGSGTLRLELANAARKVVWSGKLKLGDGQASYFYIDPQELGAIKFLNWIAEPDCDATLSSIGFQIQPSTGSLEEWAFRISLGKLRRCHDPLSGLTRDRGHLSAGAFDSISSTGLHALASALGAAEGLLDRQEVVAEIYRTLEAFESMPVAAGFLPHFTHRGGPQDSSSIHPGTEYSTVDTSLALHGLLLATKVLKLDEAYARVARHVASLDFDSVTDAEGFILHGFREDGETLLKSRWKGWGGETALVLALEAMVPARKPRGKMDDSGKVYRGVGFIGEIQSLFYPDFDNEQPGNLSGVVWPKARNRLLQRQMHYLAEQRSNSAAARLEIFGLSAGEAGLPGSGYSANGVDLSGKDWLYPHYLLMSLALSGIEHYRHGLEKMNTAGFLFPMGLPENIHCDLELYNPMQGSLNAGFEALAAYHGWRTKGDANLLYEASQKSPHLRKGAARFYSPKPADPDTIQLAGG